MFGNIICPGLTPSVSFTPPWLHSQLKNIYGSSLIGLWIGEDIVVDGSNNVTSWPGRVGGTLANIGGASLLTKSTINDRQSTNNLSSIGVGLSTTLSSALKSAYVVLNVPTLPFASSNYVLSSGAGIENILLGDIVGSTQWRTNTGFTHYRNGVATEDVSTGPQVYEAIDATSTATNFRVCGLGTGYATFDFIGKTGCCLALSTIPTQLQRLQTQFVLDSYYRPSQAPAAKLALDLYRTLGS